MFFVMLFPVGFLQFRFLDAMLQNSYQADAPEQACSLQVNYQSLVLHNNNW